jgi:arylsulfatase A-like enzyme
MSRASAAASFLVAASVACSREAATPTRPMPPRGAPDVVLVSIDSLRPDHLGCYGYARSTSPTIDALARDGARFETAVSSTSWTLPAHAALFTGLFDSAHGVVDNGLALDGRHVTLAEVLRDSGWRTAGFFGGPYLHPVFGLSQGFDTWTSCMSDDLADGESLQKDFVTATASSHADVTGPRTLAAVRAWLDAIDERPFFLFVHLWDVHYDYLPPREYLEQFDPGYTGSLDLRDLPRNAAIHSGMPARDLEHLIAAYDGEIRFTDDVLRDVLAALETNGRLANTLVVITADHGQEFFEHGDKGHQRTLFEEVVRVPLVVRWPGHVAASTLVREPVRLIDVAPTIASFAGARMPDVHGRDVGALVRGESLPAAPALLELLVSGQDLRALRTDSLKVMRQVKDGTARAWAGFDLAKDPRETQALPAADERLAPLRKAFAHEMARVRAWHEAGNPGAVPLKSDAKVDRALHRLGYTGDDR